MRAGWKRTVNVRHVFHNDDLSLEEKALAIRSAFQTATDFGSDIEELMEELVDAGSEGDVDWFDDVWSGVYDWADDHRVWVATQ